MWFKKRKNGKIVLSTGFEHGVYTLVKLKLTKKAGHEGFVNVGSYLRKVSIYIASNGVLAVINL